MKKSMIIATLALMGCGQSFDKYMKTLKKPFIVDSVEYYNWKADASLIYIRDANGKPAALKCNNFEVSKIHIGDTIK